jgi:CheY-like chemotaxis protein
MENKSVIVIDSDPSHSWYLCEGLAIAGHSVTEASGADSALEMIRHDSFDAAVVDVEDCQEVEAALLDLLRRSRSQPVIIGMGRPEALAREDLLMNRSADFLVGKPVHLERLLALISPTPSGFSGYVTGMDILEYLQFMLFAFKKAVLEVESQEGLLCRLFLDSGHIVHAVVGSEQGEAAFFQCVAFQGGRLSNLPWQEPEKRTITRSGESLLLEAAHKRG